jgi:CDP-diacylglycerol--serine O-phosphatidyltransferase
VLLTDERLFGGMRIHIAFSFILLALLADGLDGVVARKTRSGGLGDYIESMADMISMGIAPLVFIIFIYQMQITESTIMVLIVGGIFLLYLTCGVVRLASFHLMKQDAYFIGLPASAATIILLVLAYVAVPLMVILGSIILISILLVSSIPFPKANQKMNTIATLLIFGAIIFGDSFQYSFIYLLLIGIALYTILGSLSIVLRKKSNN